MSLNVYMACHEAQNTKPYEYIIPIHVGAAYSNEKYFNQTDDTGENISSMNNTYSELTAVYWMWKNCDSDFMGICHYRRFFQIEEEEIINLLKSGKIIVPKIAYLGRSIEKQYKYNHYNEIWDIMMDVLEEKHNNIYHYGANA